MTTPWLTVIVPSFGRPDQLHQCLTALLCQVEPPAAIMAVVRPDDQSTRQCVASFGAAVTEVLVTTHGVLAAMTVGLQATATEWVAFTDDDATPPPSWTAALREAAAEPSVVGVGGRDVLYDGEQPRTTTLTADVGRITTMGRIVGNHHRGTGPPRDVMVLKGVNCAYRADLLGLPTNLHGSGAQVHFEVAVGLNLLVHGRLRYDPAITVLHRPGARRDDDTRTAPSAQATADTAYNATFVMTARSRHHALLRGLRTVLVGDRTSPGLLRGLVALMRRDHALVAKIRPSLRGTFGAIRAILGGARVTFAYRATRSS